MREAALTRAPGMFLLGRHLAKSDVMAIGHEHGVVTMALIAARRPDKGAFALADKEHVAPVRMGKAERCVERGAALAGRDGARCLEGVFDALHSPVEIARHTGPVSRIDAGIAIERLDRDTAVVRES